MKYPVIFFRLLPNIGPEVYLSAILSETPDEGLKKATSKKDFDYIKMIGKGGFSNVYEGILDIKCYSSS